MRIAVCQLRGRSGHAAGRALLEKLYREETGEALPPIAIGPYGKPYFPASGLHFSISHTRRHAFCVLAHQNVGLDAEELGRPMSFSLARRVLSPGEMAQFLAAEDPGRALLTFWVLKEAQVKLTGAGLKGFPNDTDFSLSDSRVREWEGCLVALITEGQPEGETIYAF